MNRLRLQINAQKCWIASFLYIYYLLCKEVYLSDEDAIWRWCSVMVADWKRVTFLFGVIKDRCCYQAHFIDSHQVKQNGCKKSILLIRNIFYSSCSWADNLLLLWQMWPHFNYLHHFTHCSIRINSANRMVVCWVVHVPTWSRTKDEV